MLVNDDHHDTACCPSVIAEDT